VRCLETTEFILT